VGESVEVEVEVAGHRESQGVSGDRGLTVGVRGADCGCPGADCGGLSGAPVVRGRL
jgi:hypothetical protein